MTSKKNRRAEDKRVSLQQAVEMVPATGCSLALGGLTLYRRPMAFALALLASNARSGSPQNLRLLCFTAGLESDILVGAGMVSQVRSCYFGLEAFGLAPNFTSAASDGSIEIVEETEASLAYGLRAGMAGVGFMPSSAWLGTDLPRLRPDVKTVEDPYSGETLMAFPAITCDIAVIHALEADPQGNAMIGGNWGVDPELAMVADTVVITAEQIRPKLEDANIIGPIVDAVVEAPHGAWPTSCHPLYPLDGLATLEYTEKAGNEAYSALIAAWAQRHGLAITI
ncbi:MAG TPA: CoA transferase subunit A [Anaerolineae bacterium]|nr:CoA transferase subunit A [Anaerolineae bacterium]